MKPFLLVCGLLLVVSATGQEHAPILAQCRADAAVWGDADIQIEYANAEKAFETNGTPNRSSLNKLSYDTLNSRNIEMTDCMKVDPEQRAIYLFLANFYVGVVAHREYNFMTRHNLWAQFLTEDEQGKR